MEKIHKIELLNFSDPLRPLQQHFFWCPYLSQILAENFYEGQKEKRSQLFYWVQGQETEDRRQKTENRRPKTEDRTQLLTLSKLFTALTVT